MSTEIAEEKQRAALSSLSSLSSPSRGGEPRPAARKPLLLGLLGLGIAVLLLSDNNSAQLLSHVRGAIGALPFGIAPGGFSIAAASGAGTACTPEDPNGRGFFDTELVCRYASDLGVYSRHQREGRLQGDVAALGHQGKGMPRLHSLPLVTGDGFRAVADVVFDTREQLDACAVQVNNAVPDLRPGEAVVVYVDVHFHTAFFAQSCIGSLDVPVVLVTHNGDPQAPHPDAMSGLDHPRLVHWFGQNCALPHPKLTCLPIGTENRYLGPGFPRGYHGSIPEVLLGAMVTLVPGSLPVDAINRTRRHTLANWDVGTFPAERGPLAERLAAGVRDGLFPYLDMSGGKISPLEYYRVIVQHSSMICPRGNGLDALKTWEAMLLGRMPIVRTGPLDRMYENLPVLILPTWEDLSEEVVVAAVESFATESSRGTIRTEKLFIPYYLCEIGKAAGREEEFCSREGIIDVLHERGRERAAAAASSRWRRLREVEEAEEEAEGEEARAGEEEERGTT
jgi:hypothetical protein